MSNFVNNEHAKRMLWVLMTCVNFISQSRAETVVHRGPYIGCIDESTVTFSCDSDSHYLHVSRVETGRTVWNNDTTFCGSPFPESEHCIQPSSQTDQAFFKECGLQSSCSRKLESSVLGKDVVDTCGDFYQGYTYVIVHFSCNPRQTSLDVPLEVFEMGSEVNHVPRSALFLVSTDYSQLTTNTNSVCTLTFQPAREAPAFGHYFSLQVLDFSSTSAGSSCTHQLAIVNSLGTQLSTLYYCANNITAYTHILGVQGETKEEGLIQLALLQRQEDGSSARLWLKIEVLNWSGSSNGDILIACSSTSSLLTPPPPTKQSTVIANQWEQGLEGVIDVRVKTTPASAVEEDVQDSTEEQVAYDIGSSTQEEADLRLNVGIGSGLGLIALIIAIIVAVKLYRARWYRQQEGSKPVVFNLDPTDGASHVPANNARATTAGSAKAADSRPTAQHLEERGLL